MVLSLKEIFGKQGWLTRKIAMRVLMNTKMTERSSKHGWYYPRQIGLPQDTWVDETTKMVYMKIE